MSIEDEIKGELLKVIKELGVELKTDDVTVEQTKHAEHGDFASNIALKLAKPLNKSPLAIADDIIAKFTLSDIFKVEKAGPGFINFYVKSETAQSVISEICVAKENYGQSDKGNHEKTLLEYVSANPTGALHLGHARGAAVGDSMARILKKCGYDVTKEYYINDAGNQVDNLAESLKARYLQEFGIAAEIPENGYHGPDIIEFAKTIKGEVGDKYISKAEENIDFFRKRGVELALENIKKDLHEFRVDFDIFSSEKAIRDAGKVDEVCKLLKPVCYQKDGAVFLNTTKDGDDKDRVIIKSDGSYTYLLPDIAYHKDKFDRGYSWLIDLFGADHHGYIARIKSSVKSLGYNSDKLDVDLVQMVRLLKDGQEYKMSKRTGNAVSLKELCEEVGVDAVRYFFVSRAASQHLDFDLNLAKTMGTVNPVYYCQYAHARLCAIIEMAKTGGYTFDYSGKGLSTPYELALMKKMISFKETVIDAGLTLSPYKITIYVRELASNINDFYTQCRVLDPENKELSSARLGLCEASSIVLADGLALIGVTAPEHM
jgi:arginyl-tRNA synthetase